MPRLCITRKAGESVRIGDVLVTVVKSGHHVRLTIEADESVQIVRSELERHDEREQKVRAA